MKQLWVEKYRPKKIDEYVFRDQAQKKIIESWIKEKSIPHLLLNGHPGIGKTTLAKILINELEINEYDFLEINASRQRGIAEIRERITNFISMIPFGSFKVVLLDEADYLTPEAQASLRGVMEEYSSTSRFILTCNHKHLISQAIHSRCQLFDFEKIDQTEFTARAAMILVSENIDFDLETLDDFIGVTYPDLRKCINLLQQNSTTGVLLPPKKSDAGISDWKFEMAELFKSGKIREARKILCGKLTSEEMSSVYTWLYNNLAIFGDENTQDKALQIIKDGLIDHQICADPEINLSATLAKLAKLSS